MFVLLLLQASFYLLDVNGTARFSPNTETFIINAYRGAPDGIQIIESASGLQLLRATSGRVGFGVGGTSNGLVNAAIESRSGLLLIDPTILQFGLNTSGNDNLMRMALSSLNGASSEFSLNTNRVADVTNSPSLSLGANFFRVSTGAGGSPTERMRIDASGNIGIGTTTPDASSLLDITSTSKGLLIPRVALTAINAAGPITAPLTSLMVYNTATAGVSPNIVVPGYYYWNGSKWISVSGGSGVSRHFRTAGIVYFLAVTRINYLRTPGKSGS